MPAIASRPVRPLRARAALLAAAALALAALLAPAAAEAAPGDLDPSFGQGGSERFFPSEENIALRGVAAQPDDRIVLTGADYTTNSLLVVRLLPDGAFDPSFGSGGIVSVPFGPTGFGEGRAVAIQPDGKIVVAGEAKGAVDGDFLAARFEANGAPDPSFGGGDGIEVFPVGASEDRAEAVAIGAGERILLSGESRLPENKGVEASVAVLQTGGKPDPAFSLDGVTTLVTPGSEKNDSGEGIAEGADGKFVIADEAGSGAGNGFKVIRLLADGTPDPGFGTLGVVTTVIPGSATAKGRSTDVVVLPDGRLVASGYGYDEVGPKKELDAKFAAVRYLGDGKPDLSFGGAGTGIFAQQVSLGSDSAQRIALAPGGRLILAGPYSPGPSDDSLAIVRLDAAGVPDPGFGTGGVALRGPTAPFGNNFEDAAVDSRERVVVSSRDFIGGGNTEVEVSRFLGDVPPDPPATKPGAGKGQAPPANRAPHALIKKLPRQLEAAKLKGFSGTAADPDGKVAKVQVAVVARAGLTCQVLKNARARFKTVRVKRGKPCPLRWLKATGTAKWSFRLKATLPVGHYVVYARAVDPAGLAESTFNRREGNRLAFDLTAPEPPVRNP